MSNVLAKFVDEIIETYWNVNPVNEFASDIWEFRNNRNILECKFRRIERIF